MTYLLPNFFRRVCTEHPRYRRNQLRPVSLSASCPSVSRHQGRLGAKFVVPNQGGVAGVRCLSGSRCNRYSFRSLVPLLAYAPMKARGWGQSLPCQREATCTDVRTAESFRRIDTTLLRGSPSYVVGFTCACRRSGRHRSKPIRQSGAVLQVTRVPASWPRRKCRPTASWTTRPLLLRRHESGLIPPGPPPGSAFDCRRIYRGEQRDDLCPPAMGA